MPAMRAIRQVLAGALTVVGLTVLIGCGGSDSDGGGASKSTTVTIRTIGDFGSFDPYLAAHPTSGIQLFMAVTDRLVAQGPSGELRPYLASSWKTGPKSVTFTLRTDVTCADGTPLKTADVGEFLKTYFEKGQALNTFIPRDEYTVEWDDSANTITVTSSRPQPDLIYGFASRLLGIECPAALEPGAKLDTEIYGSGPYKVESLTPNEGAVLTLRPEWKWGPNGTTAADLPSKLVFTVVPSESTAANLLLAGDVNVAQITGSDVQRLASNDTVNYKPVTTYLSQVMLMNESAGHATADVNVRRALMAAITSNGWIKSQLGGYGKPTTSYLSPEQECFDPDTAQLLPQGGPDEAKSTLLDAGYSDSGGTLVKDGKPLTLRLIGTQNLKPGLEYLGAQFTAMGAKVEIAPMDTPQVNADAVAGNWDVAAFPIYSFFPVPGENIAFFTGPSPDEGGSNLYRYNDPVLDKNIADASSTTGEARCKAWGVVQKRFLSEGHIFPLGLSTFNNFTTANVTVEPLGHGNVVEPTSLRVKE